MNLLLGRIGDCIRTMGARRRHRIGAVAAVLAALTLPLLAQEQAAGGWSADLLNQILKDDAAKPPPPAPATVAPPAEMVLHTYPLTHLRVAEAGKAQNVIAILNKLLPPGSSLKPDVPGNSLHVLTTPTVHQAVWDYLSAVDAAEPAPATPAIPAEVKASLQKLVEGTERAGKLSDAIATLQTDVEKQLADIDARQRRTTFKLVGGAGMAAILGLALVVALVRRPPPKPTGPSDSTPAILAPDQLASALVPVHDKMHSDMLGLLNEVAIKLQAQHNEQQKLVREQQRQLEDARHALAEERKQFISDAGTMVVQAVERVDATTAKLAKQQDKVAELVEELQTTVRELDETKDNLRTREVELEQERAKIAALSLLLEEGAPLPAPDPFQSHNGHAPPDPVSQPANGSGTPPRTIPGTPCTNNETITLTTTPVPAPQRPATPARFNFLPPDHPET